MKIQSKLLGQNTTLFTIENEDLHNHKSHFVEKNISVSEEKYTEISCTNWVTDGVSILDFQMCYSTPQKIQFEIIGESIIMNFICCNNVEANIDSVEGDKYGLENTHNILYTPNLNATFEIPAFEKINYFSIILSLDFYSKLIHNDWGIHQLFSDTIFQKKSTYFNPNYSSFTSDIQWIIHEIKNCKYEASLKKMYLETKIKELLIFQLESLTQISEVKKEIDEDDYNKLLEAKLILEENFTKAPTLPELSRRISLNEFKLKKGFKACFETTIKSYVTKLRMEHAKKLFKNETSNVGEVAYKCGYKDVSHFSAAFKLFYGFTPMSFRNLGLNIKCQILFWGLEDIIPLLVYS